MKKQYIAPRLEIERYDLQESLAQCSVLLGPTLGGNSGCDGAPNWWEDAATGIVYFYTPFDTLNGCSADGNNKEAVTQVFPTAYSS